MSLKDVWSAARHPPQDPTDISYKDRAVLVTGANSGLGHEAAIKYARLAANPLILGVRTQAKGEEAKAAIIKETACSPDIFILETVNLETLESVKAFVDRLNARITHLHVAQLVAGIVKPRFTNGPEGHELTCQVNVLSTSLMGLLLLPKLRETAASLPEGAPPVHLSFVNSAVHLYIKPEWLTPDETLLQHINNKEKWDRDPQYYLVKLASIYFVQGLAERYGSDRLIINASCPGICKTNMGRDFPMAMRVSMAIFYIGFGRTAEAGSRTLISATNLGPESQGKLWTNDKIEGPSKFMLSERGIKLKKRTWDEIVEVLRKHTDISAI